MAINKISEFPKVTPSADDKILIEKNGEGGHINLSEMPVSTPVNTKITGEVNTLKLRIDNLVLNGGNSPDECVDARRNDNTSITYPSLKARLDAEHSELKGDLDNYLSLPTYTDVELTKVKDMVYDSETNTFSYLSGFAYADLTVSEGEEYLITGWNSGYKYCPTFLNENTVVSVIEHVGSYENLAVIVPPNANRLVINERTNNINCKAQKLQINEKSKEFLSDYEKTKSSIVDKLDNNFMVFVEQEIAIVSNMLTNINTLEKDTLSSFQTAEISVVAGEKYKISATNVSGIYPACFFCDADNNTTVAFAYTGVDVEVIVPTNATKMFINARVTVQPIIVKKYVKAETSDSFWEDYYSLHNMAKTIDPVKLTPPHIGVKYTGDGINVFLSNYSENTDLLVRLWKKTGNGLMDFGTFDKVANDSGLVLVEPTEYVRILGGETDFLSPSIVFAVNNIDGDFPNLTDGKLTGGWHTYGGGTDTSKTATARCIKVSVCCEGKPLSVGESARGSEVVVEITNRLQGSNTEKADGTGREIVEQHFKIVFSDGFRIRIDGEITALEDIKYRTYYGISADLIDNAPFHFVGCRATRQERLPSASVYRCNDKYCTGIVQKSEQDTFELGFDPTIDLGTQFANKWIHSCITGSGKAYMVLISGGTENNDFELSSGDKIYWKGYYEMYPTR